MIYVICLTCEPFSIYVIKAETLEEAKNLANVEEMTYRTLTLSTSDILTLQGNKAALIML